MLKTSKTARVFAGVVGFAMVVAAFGAFAAPVKAQTTDLAALQALVASLQAQIAALTGGSSSSSMTGSAPMAPLTVGSSGAEVTKLQNFLISKGYGSFTATGYFGSLTQSALAAFQAANGVTPAAGYYGSVTAAKVASMMGGTTGGVTPPVTPPTTGGLQGGAGSVDTYDLLSSLNNEEVGEDEEDVEVAGLEIEVDDGSDIEVTAVKLVFDEGTAGSDFEDYASEVSVWLDGDEVARVDGDAFNDDNDWTKTITLDNAVIEAEDTAELTVAVSGISNLDSNDVDDTWTVDFRQVRWVDATGASTSEDPSEDPRTFSFSSFASAADVELKVSEGDDSINDAHIIDVDDTDNTDDVEIASFNLEAEGDSDITIDEMPILFTTVGADLDEITSSIKLLVDGEEVGSESITSAATTTSVISFDDLDFTIGAGEEVEVTVVADINDTDGNFGDGDTLAVDFGEGQTDNALFDAEDEAGENLADADMTGTLSAGAHGLFATGIEVEFVSADDSVRTGAIAGDPDIADFTLKFSVMAGDDDIYVDGDIIQGSSTPTGATDGLTWATTTNSTTGTSTYTATLAVSGDSSDDVSTSGAVSYLVEAGETRTFTFTVSIPAGADSVNAGVKITGIKFDTDSGDAHANLYNFDLGDFKTDTVTGLIIH